MEIYPEKNDQLGLTENEKSFMRTIQRVFESSKLAYYVLHINPRKIASNGQAELFNLLVCDSGVLLFRFYENTDDNVALTVISSVIDYVFYKMDADIHDKLEGSRYLTDKNGRLKYAYNICLVFPNITSQNILIRLAPDKREFCKRHVIFKDTITQIRKDGVSVVFSYLNTTNIIEEEVVNNIFQRLCPEITIPRKYILNDNAMTTAVDNDVSQDDRSVLAYRLDSSQINIINKIKKGDQLILACAGSGKSVLLISKCFKIASLNPTEQFLITCFNRNLKSYYDWAIAQAGFSSKNVKCQTFHSLCLALLGSNNLYKPQPQGEANDEYWDKVFQAVNKLFLSKNKLIKHSYNKVLYLRSSWGINKNMTKWLIRNS